MKKQTKIYYRIAGHLLGVCCPEQLHIGTCLPNFQAFLEEQPIDNKQVVLWVDIRTFDLEDEQPKEQKLLSDISAHWGERFRFEESDRAYITTIQSETTMRLNKMISTKDFRQSVIHTCAEELYGGTVLSWMLMVVYAQAILQHKSVLIHASVIKKGNEGFAFLGKSGTGKSTHSRLWLKYIADSDLLNDDNPVVRIDEQGKVWIYGSPWSGKTSCYRNIGVELAGIVRLRQAKGNRWKYTAAKEALLVLLPSCTSIRWDKKLYSKMVDIAEEVTAKAPVACLDCLPDEEAAYLCFQKLTEIEITKNHSF